MCSKSLSHVRLFAAPRTVPRQAALSLGFSRQEHWRGLPCPRRVNAVSSRVQYSRFVTTGIFPFPPRGLLTLKLKGQLADVAVNTAQR